MRSGEVEDGLVERKWIEAHDADRLGAMCLEIKSLSKRVRRKSVRNVIASMHDWDEFEKVDSCRYLLKFAFWSDGQQLIWTEHWRCSNHPACLFSVESATREDQPASSSGGRFDGNAGDSSRQRSRSRRQYKFSSSRDKKNIR